MAIQEDKKEPIRKKSAAKKRTAKTKTTSSARKNPKDDQTGYKAQQQKLRSSVENFTDNSQSSTPDFSQKSNSNIGGEPVKEAKTQTAFNLDVELDIGNKVKILLSKKNNIAERYILLILLRSSLRIFPLALIELNSPSIIDKFKQAMMLWRAILVIWFSQHETYEEKPLRAQREGIDEIDKIHPLSNAIGSINDAFLVVPLYSVPKTVLQDIISDTLYSASKALNTDYLTGYNPIKDEIDFDLEWIVSSDKNNEELINKPLWNVVDQAPDEFHKDWLPLFEDLSPDEFDESSIAFSKQLLNDYQSLLTGNWDSKEPKNLKIHQVADEKTKNDLPSKEDHLGRDQLVNALWPRLAQENDDHHLTIGLMGNWGIGKSSVIQQLKKKLESVEHSDYYFAEFNAWSYEHTPNLQAGIAHETIKALTQPIKSWDIWKKRWHQPKVLWKFAVKLHGQRIFGTLLLIQASIILGYFSVTGQADLQKGVMGLGTMGLLLFIFTQLKTISAQPLANKLKTYLRLPSYQEHLGSIPVMEKDIKALCNICLGPQENNKSSRMIFFIDDLDRCNEDGIIKTFEAIRLVLGLQWVTVIIAMDHRIALPALACHFEKMSKYHQLDPMSIARDYLAKVVHLPIQLPPPDNLAVASYLSHIWDDPQFVALIQNELSSTNNETSSSSIQSENINNENSPSNIEPELNDESIEKIIHDIENINLREEFTRLSKKNNKTDDEIKDKTGFNAKQKRAFYDWLIHFNLRNPRQIKRLYNSYHLLWSYNLQNWTDENEDWYAYLLALFSFEMINEHIPFDGETDVRKAFRDQYFNSLTQPIEFTITGINMENIEQARQVIVEYQQTYNISFIDQVEPFILPAINLQHKPEEKAKTKPQK